jgi:hypothetical protein
LKGKISLDKRFSIKQTAANGGNYTWEPYETFHVFRFPHQYQRARLGAV